MARHLMRLAAEILFWAVGWLMAFSIGQTFSRVQPANFRTVVADITRRVARIRGVHLATITAPAAPVSLWSYSWAVAAVEDVAQLPQGGPFRRLLPTLLTGFGRYWDATASPPAYAPYPHPSASTVKFFDDNAWTGLDLVTAYRLTHNPRWLHQAEAIFRYEESGWDTRGGGIYWNDNRGMRNTPANAPTAELGAELYALTGRRTYLRWAVRIQRWEQRHLVDPQTGAVFDHLGASGRLGRRILSYNQGAVIGADVELYRVTHHITFLRQAEKTATFASRHLPFPTPKRPLSMAFAGVLADNLHQLWQLTHSPHLETTVGRLASSLSRHRSGHLPWDADGHRLLWESGAIRVTATWHIFAPHRAPAPSLPATHSLLRQL